ncbi:membrane protein [Staphylococcus phage CF5]|uniref:Membrane protein n=1 Tax=Staphylococcus phage CF5 TaxID=3113739 RepID=A0AAX4J7P2_9CAUD|nr:membrane protein [Staphylococcus phage CF5]
MGKILQLYVTAFLLTLLLYSIGFLFFFGLAKLIIMIFSLSINVWLLTGCIWLGYFIYRSTTNMIKDVIEKIVKDQE